MLPLQASGPKSNDNERGTPHSPKFQYYKKLTIRLFSFRFRALVWRGGRFLPPLQRCSQHILQPQPNGLFYKKGITRYLLSNKGLASKFHKLLPASLILPQLFNKCNKLRLNLQKKLGDLWTHMVPYCNNGPWWFYLESSKDFN